MITNTSTRQPSIKWLATLLHDAESSLARAERPETAVTLAKYDYSPTEIDEFIATKRAKVEHCKARLATAESVNKP